MAWGKKKEAPRQRLAGGVGLDRNLGGMAPTSSGGNPEKQNDATHFRGRGVEWKKEKKDAA